MSLIVNLNINVHIKAEYDFPVPINHVFRADVRDLNGQPLMK